MPHAHKKIATPFLFTALFLASAFVLQAQWNCARLHSFGQTNLSGEAPQAGLLAASDGWLYGTASAGGAATKGVLYKIQPDGNSFSVLWHFGVTSTDGANPSSELIESSDGRLYGTCRSGGLEGAGTVFRINKDGTGYAIIKHILKNQDGTAPYGRLVEGADGCLYGTTSLGKQWPTYKGAIFRMNHDGSNFTNLHFFEGNTADGGTVYADLLASGNTLFGTTYSAGSNSYGTLFRINLDGSDYRILYHFAMTSTNGSSPQARLIEDAEGRIYGVMSGCWSYKGAIFRTDKEGTNYEVLHRFASSGLEGDSPVGGLAWGPGDFLYGVTQYGGQYNAGVLFKMDRDGGNFTVLRHFQGGLSDGWQAAGVPTLGANAAFGITAKGGLGGGGTIYKLDLNNGNYLVLQHFPKTSKDGQSPYFPLVEGPDGALYGSASGGFWGNGVLFTISKAGVYTVIHQFGALTNDGSSPSGGLLLASDGFFYGVTRYGGQDGYGTLFRFRYDGTDFTNFYRFSSYPNGYHPTAGLIEGRDGWLYGSTTWGGTNSNGTLFRIQKNGSGYMDIHHFSSFDDIGGAPIQQLLEGLDGMLYGITEFSRSALFKLSKTGSNFTVLHTFPIMQGNQIGGLKGPLIQGTNGLLYGTTMFLDDPRGTVGATIFQVSTNGGLFGILRRFTFPSTNQANSKIWLCAGEGNWLYGALANNGDSGGGMLFRFDPITLNYELLWTLRRSTISPHTPSAALCRGSDGIFYGVSPFGGDFDLGGIFRLGTNFQTQVQLLNPAGGSQSFQFTFRAESNILYQSEYSSGNNLWLPLSRYQGVGGEITITDTNKLDQIRLYRVFVP